MQCFIYQADVYCVECGRAIRRDLIKNGRGASDDSDSYPKGPVESTEADYPVHCAAGAECLDFDTIGDTHYGCFLENPLTDDGRKYVLDQHRERPTAITAFWLGFYGLEIPEPGED